MASAQVFLCCLISKIGDWTIRVDPPHGSAAHSRKHVHVRKKGLKGEYSWNIDGTRHDEHRFPVSEKCIARAKEHAAEALRIPVSSLSLIVGFSRGARVAVRTNITGPSGRYPVLNAYVRRAQALVVLASELGLVLVVTDDA